MPFPLSMMINNTDPIYFPGPIAHHRSRNQGTQSRRDDIRTTEPVTEERPSYYRHESSEKAYIPSPIEKAQDAIARYESAYRFSSTVHTSIAILVQEVIPIQISQNKTLAAHEKMHSAVQGLFAKLGLEEIILGTAHPKTGISKQREDALLMLQECQKISELRSVAAHYEQMILSTERTPPTF